MLTIKPEIKKAERKKDGTFNVKLRFTQNRKVKRISTSIYVQESDISISGEIKASCPMRNEIENLVLEYKLRIAKLQVDLNNYTLERIMDLLKLHDLENTPIDFLEFSKKWIENTNIKGKKNYNSALNSFMRFLNKTKLDITDVNLDLINGYIAYLRKLREEKIKVLSKEGLRIPSDRTMSLYLSSIHHLYKEAMNHYNRPDMGVVIIKSDPFQFITIPKQETTRKRAIPPELIRKIYELPYKVRKDGKERESTYNLAKDCFILSFSMMGMNSVDLHTCTDLSEGVITYYRTKTKERRQDEAKMQVTVPSFVLPIFMKYRDSSNKRVFNFYKTYNTYKNFNRAINKGLKEIGELIGVEDLEFYAARHSWATIAINKCKIDKYTVHAALNHVDPSMRVTDIYIERDFVNENEANKKVLDFVFGG